MVLEISLTPTKHNFSYQGRKATHKGETTAVDVDDV